MTIDIYRAPEGASEAKLPQEKLRDEVSQKYIDSVDVGLKQEIGWIVGEIPAYKREAILKGKEKGGVYYPHSGQIVVNDEGVAINYPHEKLHWLSRHKKRKFKVLSRVVEKVLTGSKVELPRTEDESLRWLSEAIISETTQIVLALSGVVFPPLVQYTDDLGSPINKYVSGWQDAGVRRVGDFFKNSAYSELYGQLFRPLVIKMGTFLSTDEGRDLYNALILKSRLPSYSLSDTFDDHCKVAIKVFQVGEFGLDNSVMYQMLDKMLGRGKLKDLVRISKRYDALASMKLGGNDRLDQNELELVKSSLLELING